MLKKSTCHSTDGATIANNTLFGWTLGGVIPDVSLPTSILRVQGKEDPLDSLLQSMWTLDQSPDVSTNISPRMMLKLLLIFTILTSFHQTADLLQLCLELLIHPPWVSRGLLL